MDKKYSKAFKRDLRFYWINRHKFCFFGDYLPTIEYDPNGINGVKCFWNIDSKGKYLPTKHVRITRALLSTKKSIGWHLILWAEGYNDMFMGTHEYIALMKEPPDWVEKSFRKQQYIAYKKSERKKDVHRKITTI